MDAKEQASQQGCVIAKVVPKRVGHARRDKLSRTLSPSRLLDRLINAF